MDRIIYGADTETVIGQPNTLQFYSEDTSPIRSEIFFVDKKTAINRFLKWCGTLKPGYEHVIYIHNLAFDLVELLYGSKHHAAISIGEFDFTVGDWSIKGIYGTPTFCTLTRGGGRSHTTTIMLVDSYSFYRGSLRSAAELYCPDLPKLATPKDIGKVRIRPTDKAKVAYAMRDAEVSYHIGKAIDAIHREFDIKQAVSIADMAAKIFRHNFLNHTIPQPDTEIVQASMYSYHGGKNGMTGAPGWHEGITSIDISSAYPKAMSDMPAFADGSLYKKYRKAKGSVKSVPPYGVYQISGMVADCDYPCLFTDGFKAIHGHVDSQWVQGFDLNEALRSREIKLTQVRGTYYDAPKDHGAPSLRAYVSDFYGRKQNEADPVRRYMYKLLLNSLYGKFIQTRKRNLQGYVDIDTSQTGETRDLIAGGLFHPFIASAITADCRARIHRLEHHWDSLHTATDAVFTRAKVVARTDAKSFDLYPGAHRLGAMEVECRGDLLLVRNKCYIIYANKETDKKSLEKGFDSKTFPGKVIIKRAMHGFQGSVYDLEQLIGTGRRKYRYTHVNKLKESVRRGLQVNEFVEREGTLKVGPIGVMNGHRRKKHVSHSRKSR